MKNTFALLLFSCFFLFAQSTTVPDAQKVVADATTDAATIAALQAQGISQNAQNATLTSQNATLTTQLTAANNTIATLTTQNADVTATTNACPQCIPRLASIMAGAAQGQYWPETTCCTNPVPPTPPVSYILFIFQTPAQLAGFVPPVAPAAPVVAPAAP